VNQPDSGGQRRCRVAFVALLVGLAATAGNAAADQASGPKPFGDQLSVGGSVRAAYWTSSRALDGREDLPVAALWLRGGWEPHPLALLIVDGWVGNDDLFHARDTTGALREAYVDLRPGPVDLRIGKQIIPWGRADRINPTDTLTPRDFTLLVPEDADQRIGTTGVSATAHLGGTSITGIVLPTFTPHVIPIRRPPPGSTLRERTPDDPVAQGAAKIGQTGGRVDWSLSYYDGYDLFPDLQIASIRPDGLDLVLTHQRVRVIGADAAAAVGPYTVRGEAAYTFTEHPSVKRPFFFLVVGADRTVPGAVYVNLQYVLRVVSDFQRSDDIADPIRRQVAIEQALINDQLDQVKHAFAVRLARSWLDETLKAEVSAIVSPTRGDYAVRPKLAYAVTDHLKLIAGADFIGGPTRSFFGRLRDTSTAYVEARWDF
jgi:hypothetical protein